MRDAPLFIRFNQNEDYQQIRARYLGSLRLGKQAPEYKRAKQHLRFVPLSDRPKKGKEKLLAIALFPQNR